MRFAALAGFVVLAGCGHVCPPRVERVVAVSKPCDLPPLHLPGAKRSPCGEGRDGWSCYDARNSAALAGRISAMRAWIVEARARCGKIRGKVDADK